MKLYTETLIEEVQSVVLETDELEYHEEPHVYANSGNLRQSSSPRAEKNLMLLF